MAPFGRRVKLSLSHPLPPALVAAFLHQCTVSHLIQPPTQVCSACWKPSFAAEAVGFGGASSQRTTPFLRNLTRVAPTPGARQRGELPLPGSLLQILVTRRRLSGTRGSRREPEPAVLSIPRPDPHSPGWPWPLHTVSICIYCSYLVATVPLILDLPRGTSSWNKRSEPSSLS